MKLKLKLPLAFGFTLALLLAAALVGIYMLYRSLDTFGTTVQTHLAHERAVRDIELSFKTQVQEWKNTLLRGKDPKQLDQYWKTFQKEEQEVASEAKHLHEALPPGEAKSLIDQFALAHTKMGEGYRKGYEAFVASGFDAAAGDAAVKGMDREPSELLDKASRRIEADSLAISQKASAGGQWAVRMSLVVMAAMSVLGVAVGVVVSRRIVKPIDDAVRMAKAVAGGDLTVAVQAQGDDETAQLLQSLQDMQTQLTSLVRGVRQNAEGVASASTQIAQGNTDLSSRTEQQAAALQQSASSMEQLGDTVRHTADNALQANQLAQGASDVANRGGRVVDDVVETMKGIQDSSLRIADIISVIDGIAFQTNILALNAAVEAARAGEQGRGFAVVAGEVRALAQRSATAAKEIKELIGASVERVERGTALVDQAGATMTEVVTAIRRVTDIVGEISAATGDQSLRVTQIGQAVTQMDQATQQNAALVEESAAAAESLKHQAHNLVDAVAVFQLSTRAELAVQ